MMADLIYDREEKITWLAEKSVLELATWIEDFLRNGKTGRLSIQRRARRSMILVYYYNSTDNAVFKEKFREAIAGLIEVVTLVERNLPFYSDLITIAGLTRCIKASERLDQIIFERRLQGREAGKECLHKKTLAVFLGLANSETVHFKSIIERDIDVPEYAQLCFRACIDAYGVDNALWYLPKILNFCYQDKTYSIAPTLEILIDCVGLGGFVKRFYTICAGLDEIQQREFVRNLLRTEMSIRIRKEIQDEPDYLEFIWKGKKECFFPDTTIYGILKPAVVEMIAERETCSTEEIEEDINEILEGIPNE